MALTFMGYETKVMSVRNKLVKKRDCQEGEEIKEVGRTRIHYKYV